MRNILIKLLEIKEKARSMFCKFFHENLTIYVIKWKNMVQPCRPHLSILYDVWINCVPCTCYYVKNTYMRP